MHERAEKDEDQHELGHDVGHDPEDAVLGIEDIVDDAFDLDTAMGDRGREYFAEIGIEHGENADPWYPWPQRPTRHFQRDQGGNGGDAEISLGPGARPVDQFTEFPHKIPNGKEREPDHDEIERPGHPNGYRDQNQYADPQCEIRAGGSVLVDQIEPQHGPGDHPDATTRQRQRQWARGPPIGVLSHGQDQQCQHPDH